MENFLLRQYAPDELKSVHALFDTACRDYPYTISHTVQGLVRTLSEGHYSKAMNYALDLFETAGQYISAVLFALLKDKSLQQGTRVHTLERVIRKIDGKRPLSFGDWCNDILAPLAAEAAVLMPQDPLVKSLSAVLRPKRNIYLGGKGEPSIVQIRNEYKGHGTTLSEEIYKGVVFTMEPRIIELLKAFYPLQQARYIARPLGGGTPLSLNGQAVRTRQEFADLAPGHYRIHLGEQVLTDLYPLAFCDERGYIYLFQSLVDERISYVSSNEDALRLTTDSLNEDFDAYMQQILPSFDISESLNWEEWLALTHRQSASFLRRIYNEKKYNRELFVDRKALTREFDAFVAGGASVLPLAGDAGQGKTNQLCYWCEQLMQQQKAVMIFSGAEFATSTLPERIREVFGASPRKPMDKILSGLDKAACERGEKVIIFFDALNECLTYAPRGEEPQMEGPEELYRSIFDVLRPEAYTSLKIVFTCRSFTWKNLLFPIASRQEPSLFHRSSDSEETAVKGFTEEELRQAYAIYGELYQMHTPYGELTKGSIIRMRDPLVLKIVCTNFLGRDLPTRMSSYSSISLFHKMLSDISSSYAGNRQKDILLEMAAYFLESYESGTPIDSVSFAQLHHATQGRLGRMAQLFLKEDGTTVAFGELLNKPERPVLRFVEESSKEGEGKIQFIYERFLEYMMAYVYCARESVRGGISPEKIRNTISGAALNEVFMGTMRNVLIMDYLTTASTATIINLAACGGDDYNVAAIVNDVIGTLVGENYEEQIFSIVGELLSVKMQCTDAHISEFNSIVKAIQSNKATDGTIARYRSLSATLAPLLRLRQLATVTLLNGIFLTDYYNESVYGHDPFALLRKLLSDPITDVRNDACMYCYYVSYKSRTLSGTPLKANISHRIVERMYQTITGTPLVKIPIRRAGRQMMVNFLEIATRINVLLIIDSLLKGDRSQVGVMLGATTGVFRHITWNFRLVRLMMPFFSMILRKQITFQSAYVNNVIEYQSFWDESVIPLQSGQGQWSRRDLKEIMGTIFSYSRYKGRGAEAPDFSVYIPKVLSAYRTGDSFSYFALERLLIINGLCDQSIITPIIDALSSPQYRSTQWYDYSQMSMIYVLYQIGMKAEELSPKIMYTLGEWCAEWTRRCRGYFRARNSHKANPMQLYKRNVMTWYAMVCTHRAENVPQQSPRLSMPLFYDLIDEAIDKRDKELLVHLADNISELVADSGYITPSLELLKYILTRIDSQKMLDEFEANAPSRYPGTSEDLVSLVGKLLGTAKNYSPKEVDAFLKKEMSGLKFPGISRYREEILNYNPGGETLSDVFTHKFGNFLIWSLVHEEAVDGFAYEAMCAAPESDDCIKWFDSVVRILFKHLFNVKI